MLNCLSAVALKWLIYISCIIVLGIGSVLVWIGFLVQSSQFIQVLEYSYAGFIIIACGGILIFVAFIGIVGAWKQRKFFLTLFIISSLVVGILLMIFGGVLIYIRNVSGQYLKDSSTCRLHFQAADDTALLASQVFCGLYCPCNLDSATVAKLNITDFYKGSAVNTINCNPCESIQTYDTGTQIELEIWIQSTLGYVVNATNCAITTTEYEDAYYGTYYEKYIPLMTWLETQFSCSGLCTSQKIYYFSDVTSGLPSNLCYTSVKNWAESNFMQYGIVSIVLGFYELVILYLAFSLCCCPKRKLDLPPSALNSPVKGFKS